MIHMQRCRNGDDIFKEIAPALIDSTSEIINKECGLAEESPICLNNDTQTPFVSLFNKQLEAAHWTEVWIQLSREQKCIVL